MPGMHGHAERVDASDVGRIEECRPHETDDDVEPRLLGRRGERRQLGDAAAGTALRVDLGAVDLLHGQAVARVRDQRDRADDLPGTASDEDPGCRSAVIGGDATARDVRSAVAAGDVLGVGQAKGAVEIGRTEGEADLDIIGDGVQGDLGARDRRTH
jgi:hypothetical protein